MKSDDDFQSSFTMTLSTSTNTLTVEMSSNTSQPLPPSPSLPPSRSLPLRARCVDATSGRLDAARYRPGLMLGTRECDGDHIPSDLVGGEHVRGLLQQGCTGGEEPAY